MMAIKDPKIYIFILMDFCVVLVSSFSNFFPTSVPGKFWPRGTLFIYFRLIATLGYSTTITLVMAA